MLIRPLTAAELPILTQLFDYNDPTEMIKQNERNMNSDSIDIFVMFDNDHPIGDGQIDYERFFGFVKCMGYTGDLTIESTSFDNTGVIDFERMNQSIRIIREY